MVTCKWFTNNPGNNNKKIIRCHHQNKAVAAAARLPPTSRIQYLASYYDLFATPHFTTIRHIQGVVQRQSLHGPQGIANQTVPHTSGGVDLWTPKHHTTTSRIRRPLHQVLHCTQSTTFLHSSLFFVPNKQSLQWVEVGVSDNAFSRSK